MKDQLVQMQHQVQADLMRTRAIEAVTDGSIELRHYVSYLVDVHAYAQHSSQVIALAGARLVPREPQLAEYLFRHAGEELGHDKWAAEDLRELGVDDRDPSRMSPSSACLRMIGLEYLYAERLNPVGLFGWMFALETLGGTVGGAVGMRLNRTLGLDGRGLRFLLGHAEADSHHSEDLFNAIAEHVKAPQDVDAVERMARESVDLYCAILDASFDAPRS